MNRRFPRIERGRISVARNVKNNDSIDQESSRACNSVHQREEGHNNSGVTAKMAKQFIGFSSWDVPFRN